MTGPNTWKDFYRGVKDAMDQAEKQNNAVKGTDKVIEWHFAEAQVGEYFRKQFERADYDHIIVFYTPLQKVFDTYHPGRLA